MANICTKFSAKILRVIRCFICYTYTTGSSALPDIYAQAWGPQARGCVRIYQAKHECLWYKCYVPHCPCRLLARQLEVETRIYYIDCLGKFDYGPAHASRNHRYTYVYQQKRANPMESVESSYKRLKSCFVAIASFHKVYYTSKGLTFFLKQLYRVFQKMGVVLN